MKLTLQEMLIYEARNPELNYKTIANKKGEVDRVIVELEGTDSAVFTKLGGRIKRMIDACALLANKIEDLKSGWKDKHGEHKGLRAEIADLFDPADVVVTRVVNTVSFTMNLAKKAKAKKEQKITDWEAVAQNLIGLIDDDLEDVIASTIDHYTKIKEESGKEKEVALRVEPIVKEAFGETIKALGSKVYGIYSKLAKQISRWAINYDTKLETLRKEFRVVEKSMANPDQHRKMVAQEKSQKKHNRALA